MFREAAPSNTHCFGWLAAARSGRDLPERNRLPHKSRRVGGSIDRTDRRGAVGALHVASWPASTGRVLDSVRLCAVPRDRPGRLVMFVWLRWPNRLLQLLLYQARPVARGGQLVGLGEGLPDVLTGSGGLGPQSADLVERFCLQSFQSGEPVLQADDESGRVCVGQILGGQPYTGLGNSIKADRDLRRAEPTRGRSGHVKAAQLTRPRLDPGVAVAGERSGLPFEKLHEPDTNVTPFAVSDAADGQGERVPSGPAAPSDCSADVTGARGEALNALFSFGYLVSQRLLCSAVSAFGTC